MQWPGLVCYVHIASFIIASVEYKCGNLVFLCVFLIILYWDRTTSSRGLGCTADGKTVKTAEPRISTSFQRGIVLTCFAPALHWGGIFPLSRFYWRLFWSRGRKHYKILWREPRSSLILRPKLWLVFKLRTVVKIDPSRIQPLPLAHQIEMSLLFVKSTGTKGYRSKRRIYIRRYEHRSGGPPTKHISW